MMRKSLGIQLAAVALLAAPITTPQSRANIGINHAYLLEEADPSKVVTTDIFIDWSGFAEPDLKDAPTEAFEATLYFIKDSNFSFKNSMSGTEYEAKKTGWLSIEAAVFDAQSLTVVYGRDHYETQDAYQFLKQILKSKKDSIDQALRIPNLKTAARGLKHILNTLERVFGTRPQTTPSQK